MKMKRTAAFFLALTTLLLTLCACLTAYGASDDTVNTNKISDAFELSDPNGAFGITLTPSELLSLLIGGELTQTEAEYLDRYFEYYASYSTPAAPSLVMLQNNGDTLAVTAESYSYTAENGTVVTWLPKYAISGETTAEFTQSAPYTAIFEKISTDTVTVLYSCEIELDADAADNLLNFAYSEAFEAQSIDGATQYAEALALWRAYIEAMEKYEDDLTAYNDYLSELEEYKKQKAKYDAYLPEQEKYLKELAVYEKYVADYNAYLAAKAEYERAYLESSASNQKYVEYLNNLNTLRASMDAMESLFEVPTSGSTGTLFKALQNPELINMLEKYKSTVVLAYEITEQDITEMRAASNDLNALLKAYAEAREESEAAAFRYYKENYTKICTGFNYLYDRMTASLSGRLFNHICAKIELEYGTGWMGEYKKWRVKNVLAHIYLICLCLDDTQTAEGTWIFFDDSGNEHKYHFSDLLDQNLILPDTNSADPASLSWIDEPERIPLPSVPKEPKHVDEPLAPQKVEKPTEPTEISKPTKPTEVKEPAVPSAEDFSLVRKTVGISELIKNGELTERTPSAQTRSLKLDYSLVIAVPSDTPKVSFYTDNGEYISSVATNDGNIVTPTPPTRADERFLYEFDAWSLSPTENTELPSSTDTDIIAYALYGKTPKTYTVKFDIGGTVTEAEYEYGTMPTLPTNTQKEPTNDTVYTFAGWEPEPYTVREDITYTAQYLETERSYTVTWRTPDGDTVRYAPYGATPIPPVIRDIYYVGLTRFELTGWSPSVDSVSADVIYEAQYSQTVLADPTNSENSLTLESLSDGYILSGDGRLCDISGLLKTASGEEKGITLCFGRLTAAINAEAVKRLYRQGAKTSAVITDTEGGTGIAFYDANGASVSPYSGEIRISLDGYTENKDSLSVNGYYANGTHKTVASSHKDGTVSFVGTANATYRVTPMFTLTLEVSEGGIAFSASQRYAAGAKTSVFAYPDTEYIITSIKLKNNASGEETKLKALSELIMPEYDATLIIEFSQKKYTVTFIARGEIISSEQYLLGEEVEVPEALATYDEDGYRYTFIGWTKPVDAVTSDAEYVAKYFSYPIPIDKKGEVIEENKGTTWAMGTVIVEIIIPVGILFVILISGGITIGILLAKNRRIKKKRAARLAAIENTENENKNSSKDEKNE